MSFLGIGGPELILIVVLIILILGPERAPQAARAIGRQWRAITSAEWWEGLLQMWHFMRNLPQNMAEFAEVKEIQASLSDELSQVQDLTKGIQTDIESVTKPVQTVLSGNVVRDTMQEMSDELTQSLPKIGGPASADEAAGAATEAAGAATEAAEPATKAAEPATKGAEAATEAAEAATEGAEPTTEGTDLAAKATDPTIEAIEPAPAAVAPQPAVTPPPPIPSLGMGEDVDEQMMALAEQISEQIEQLPVALARLEELESQQVQLDSQLQRLQQTLDSILTQQDDNQQAEARSETPTETPGIVE